MNSALTENASKKLESVGAVPNGASCLHLDVEAATNYWFDIYDMLDATRTSIT